MNSPAISILVPTYNAAAYLPELCRSVQAQTYRDFEVILLDDGSTDDTARVLSEFSSDTRFQATGWKQNQGLNAAWRELLKRARGKYWVSPGADDRLLPDFLARRLALLEKHSGPTIAHGPAWIIDETGKRIPGGFPRLNLPAKTDSKQALRMLLQHNFINQPSALVQTETTRRVLRLFQCDWKYAPDWHLWILHAAAGAELLWDETPALEYRIHSNSLSYHPSKDAVRRAEIRLAPLSALSAAASLSPFAADCWMQWRKTLYRLWLVRAAKLRWRGMLRNAWTEAAADAFYESKGRKPGLFLEVFRHLPGMFSASVRERLALRHQAFHVSGVAQIDDPVFKRRAA